MATPSIKTLHTQLLRFFSDPPTLLATLTQTKAVISGSFALQFFLSTTWPDSDIDILVSHTSAQPLIDYIEKSAGYDWARDAGVYGQRGIRTVKTYFGPPHYSAAFGSPQIQLVVLNVEPARNVLENYYATHIINFITGEAAYCCFPELTKAKVAYLTRNPGFYEELFERKYGRRGVKLLEMDEEAKRRVGFEEGSEAVVQRAVGDAKTWIVEFGDGGDSDQVKDDGVRGTAFEIRYQDGNGEVGAWLPMRMTATESK